MTMAYADREADHSNVMEETLRGAASPNGEREVVASDYPLPLEKVQVIRHTDFNVQSPTRSPGKTGSAITDLSASPYTHLHQQNRYAQPSHTIKSHADYNRPHSDRDTRSRDGSNSTRPINNQELDINQQDSSIMQESLMKSNRLLNSLEGQVRNSAFIGIDAGLVDSDNKEKARH